MEKLTINYEQLNEYGYMDAIRTEDVPTLASLMFLKTFATNSDEPIGTMEDVENIAQNYLDNATILIAMYRKSQITGQTEFTREEIFQCVKEYLAGSVGGDGN